MSKSVFGIATTHGQAERIVEQLQAQVLQPRKFQCSARHRRHAGLGHVKATKAPEGATTGAATGGATGGVIGLLAGIGALAIPGVGPLSPPAQLWRRLVARPSERRPGASSAA